MDDDATRRPRPEASATISIEHGEKKKKNSTRHDYFFVDELNELRLTEAI